MISRTFTMPSQLLLNTEGEDERESTDEDEDTNLDDNYIQPSTSKSNLPPIALKEEVFSYAAKWILKTREGYKLTQSALENIIQDVTSLTQFLLHKTYIAVEEASLLARFQTLKQCSTQMAYLEDHFRDWRVLISK